MPNRLGPPRKDPWPGFADLAQRLPEPGIAPSAPSLARRNLVGLTQSGGQPRRFNSVSSSALTVSASATATSWRAAEKSLHAVRNEGSWHSGAYSPTAVRSPVTFGSSSAPSVSCASNEAAPVTGPSCATRHPRDVMT